MKGQRLLEPSTHVSLDGKSLRASHEDGVPFVHLLSVFVMCTQGVMGQTKMKKSKNEITAVIRNTGIQIVAMATHIGARFPKRIIKILRNN